MPHAQSDASTPTNCAAQLSASSNIITAKPTATTRLPSNELLRVVWGGNRAEINHHFHSPEQRWAYDFVVEPAMHSSPNLADYPIYNTLVVAPSNAVVDMIIDGEPDHSPGRLSGDTKNPLGNFVSLKLASDTFLIIAHLKPGSLLVKSGDVVREGTPLGRCGNSGNSSEPHIHIHHQQHSPRSTAFGTSEALPLYFRDHNGPAMPEGGVEIKVVLTGNTVQHK